MEAILKFNLPEDEEQFNVASKAMDWALLAWDIDQSIRTLAKNIESENRFLDGEQALEHIRETLHDIMEEKGLQFPP